ncbi:MAG: hypothetical protein ACKODH_12695, partial [Limisphaerales bacterium]
MHLHGDGALDFFQRGPDGLAVAELQTQPMSGWERQDGPDAREAAGEFLRRQTVVARATRLARLEFLQGRQREGQRRVVEARVPPATQRILRVNLPQPPEQPAAEVG